MVKSEEGFHQLPQIICQNNTNHQQFFSTRFLTPSYSLKPEINVFNKVNNSTMNEYFANTRTRGGYKNL